MARAIVLFCLGLPFQAGAQSSGEGARRVDDPTDGGRRIMRVGINMNYYARGFEEAFVPGYLRFAESDPRRSFRDDFLTDLAPFSVIRFHQWGRQEFSTETDWEDRQPEEFPLPVGDERTYQEIRVPLIWHIRLCNTVGADLWVNIPTSATESYVRDLAILVATNLRPDLMVYVEYSNEVWNFDYGDDGRFGPENPRGSGQYTVALRAGAARGFGLSAAERREFLGYFSSEDEAQRFFADLIIADYVVHASARAWNQFEQVFGREQMGSRVIRVLPGQMPDAEGEFPRSEDGFPDERDYYLGLIDRHLAGLGDPNINPWGQHADAYAVASYFGIGLDGGDPGIFPRLELDVKESIVGARSVRNRLDEYEAQTARPIALVGYEGGMHIWPHDNPLPANLDPRMYEIYSLWLEGIAPCFELMNHYSLVSPHGRFGDDNAFGLLEFQGQPRDEAHKYRAVVDWIARNE